MRLSEKHRPKCIADIVGQPALTRALRDLADHPRFEVIGDWAAVVHNAKPMPTLSSFEVWTCLLQKGLGSRPEIFRSSHQAKIICPKKR